MLTWPHWIRHSVPPALKCSLVSSFAHKIPSVCAAVATSTVQRCTLQPTIWTQAPYHPSCRLVYNYANHLSIIILMCILLYMYLLTGLTQVEEMLISGVLPIMSLYRLPHGQYAYSGHVINLPQDVASFASCRPRPAVVHARRSTRHVMSGHHPLRLAPQCVAFH